VSPFGNTNAKTYAYYHTFVPSSYSGSSPFPQYNSFFAIPCSYNFARTSVMFTLPTEVTRVIFPVNWTTEAHWGVDKKITS